MSDLILPSATVGWPDFTDPPTPRVDQELFKKYCFWAARETASEIKQAVLHEAFSNHVRIVIENANGLFQALCNKFHPFVAFSKGIHQNNDGEYDFVDISEFERIFSLTGEYRVWTVAELLEKPTEERLSKLQKWERKEIKMNRPRCLGAIIFNCWDD